MYIDHSLTPWGSVIPTIPNLLSFILQTTLPKGQTVDSWADSLAETFVQQLTITRLAAEDEARKKEDARRAQRREAQALVKSVERRKV